ncbi:UNVERIFIED_CONTAM: hypothetical protein DES50_1232 [Williamsia faeni]
MRPIRRNRSDAATVNRALTDNELDKARSALELPVSESQDPVWKTGVNSLTFFFRSVPLTGRTKPVRSIRFADQFTLQAAQFDTLHRLI